MQTIDQDLGRSGCGLDERPGFQRLVAEVCSGNVGAVLCIEASRLARNGREWHQLFELCGLVGTLVIEPEGIYDPRFMNDRLLLGLYLILINPTYPYGKREVRTTVVVGKPRRTRNHPKPREGWTVLIPIITLATYPRKNSRKTKSG